MRYYSSLRLRFDRTVAKDMVMLSGKKEATKVVRRERVKMTVWKNRFGSSHREVILPINYMTERPTATRLGFDDARGCLEFLRDEKHLLNYKNEEGKSTGYWYLDGDPTVRKLWRNWVLAYNTDETVRDLVRDVVLLAAADKWAPDTGDLDEGFDLGQGEEPEQPVPAPTKPKAKAK